MPLVESIQPQSAAMAAGLQPGDVILSLDGVPLVAFSELQAKVGASNGAPLALTIWRAGQYLDITLSGRQVDIPNGQGGFESRVLIGIGGGVFFEPRTYTPGLSEMAEISASRTVGIVTTSLSAIYHIIKGKISACNLQGPIGMAGTAGDTATQGLSEFVNFIAVLSTAIGLLNLFPVPVLDGGHLVFFAYEAIARRKPNEKVMNVMMTTGLVLVLGLMVFAFSADIFCRWLPALEGIFQ
jgi:regulator of sigma E protease